MNEQDWFTRLMIQVHEAPRINPTLREGMTLIGICIAIAGTIYMRICAIGPGPVVWMTSSERYAIVYAAFGLVMTIVIFYLGYWAYQAFRGRILKDAWLASLVISTLALLLFLE